MDTKLCPRCGEQRPIDEFYVNKGRPDGLSPLCVKHARLATNESSKAKRLAFVEAMGGKCERCGFNDPRALQVDHVNGNGRIERATGGRGSKFYAKVLADRSRYMLLCANCNQIKKCEQDETVGGRVYARQTPTEKLRGVGKGNAPGSQGNLNTSSERQKARARAYWDSLTPEQREERRRKQSAATTGRKLVDGHWVRPG